MHPHEKRIHKIPMGETFIQFTEMSFQNFCSGSNNHSNIHIPL